MSDSNRERVGGRAIVSEVSDPGFLMALDETFHTLAVVDRDRPPVLHFYRKSPSISLGYFQSVMEAVDIEACRELGVGIFRRKSGGGTIYEDRDQLIYGLILPRPEDLGVPRLTLDSFRFLNGPLISTLQDLGFPAEYVPVNDILIRGRKVSGCAQTRTGGVLLQHGTLIFRHDPAIMFRVLTISGARMTEKTAAKGLKGPADRVTSLRRESMGMDEMEDVSENDHRFHSLLDEPSLDAAIELVRLRLLSRVSGALGIRFDTGSITSEERDIAEELAQRKYRDDGWTFRR